MTALLLSKRGCITLLPEMLCQLGLHTSKHPMILAEMRDSSVFLQPASAISVRDIPLDEIKQWIAEDEKDVEAFWNKIT